MACTNLNPCACLGKCTPDDPIDPLESCECLDLGYITVYPDDSVGPCNQVGTISFTDCYDFCACENENATITVLNIEPADAITVNTITTAGMNFTTNSEIVDAYDKVEVTIKATCISATNEDEVIGDHTVITIFIKDDCKGVICGEGETCNQCTGECEDDINLTAS